MLISYNANKKSSPRLPSWQPSLIFFNIPIESGSIIKPCTLKHFQVTYRLHKAGYWTTGQTSGLDSVHIGTIRKILSSWWLHIKLTHSRMSVGYHEWPGVLFIGVWRASACSPGRELCCLDGETRNSAHAQKKPILVLWMQFSFLRFKLKEEPLTYTGIATQCWKAVASKKLLPSIATDMHFLSRCGYFSHGLLRW